MKTRLNYLVIASCIGLFALSAEALSSKSEHPTMNQEIEVAGLAQNDTLPELKPYYSFSSPAGAIEFMMNSEDCEQYARGILPQMANEELSYVEKLINSDHDGFIVVDKSRMKVIKFNRFGVEEECFGMACAKNYGTKHEKGDCRTPEGFFSVKHLQNSTDWHYVDDNGVVSELSG